MAGEGISSDPEKQAAVSSPGQCWEKRLWASQGSELCFGVLSGGRGLPGCSFQEERGSGGDGSL